MPVLPTLKGDVMQRIRIKPEGNHYVAKATLPDGRTVKAKGFQKAQAGWYLVSKHAAALGLNFDITHNPRCVDEGC
jgi:hypothetical protein